jgi:hypothetical protein
MAVMILCLNVEEIPGRSKEKMVGGQFRFSRHSGESPKWISLGPESRFVPFFNMDAAGVYPAESGAGMTTVSIFGSPN